MRVVAECPDCERLPVLGSSLDGAVVAVRALEPALRELEARERQLSAEVRSVLGLLRHLRREIAGLRGAHVACAVCGLLAGPGHVVLMVELEPFGPALVCATCRRDLVARRCTAAELVRVQFGEDRREREAG